MFYDDPTKLITSWGNSTLLRADRAGFLDSFLSRRDVGFFESKTKMEFMQWKYPYATDSNKTNVVHLQGR